MKHDYQILDHQSRSLVKKHPHEKKTLLSLAVPEKNPAGINTL